MQAMASSAHFTASTIDWVNDKTLLNLELKHTFSLDKFVELIESNISSGKLSRDNLLVSSLDHHQLMWLKQKTQTGEDWRVTAIYRRVITVSLRKSSMPTAFILIKTL